MEQEAQTNSVAVVYSIKEQLNAIVQNMHNRAKQMNFVFMAQNNWNQK